MILGRKNLFLALILILSPFVVSAQVDSLSFSEKFPQIKQQLDVTVTPETPKPGEAVTITIEAYDLDLNSQLITWKVNGKTELKGVGQKRFTFNLGQAGEVSSVDLLINTNSGSEISQSFQFAPANVDLLWQANTYTPPFYKGKALYTPESNVMFVAMPNILSNGNKVNSANTVYTWKLNYDVQGSLSGFGKNTFNFNGPIFIRPTTVEATAYAASDQTNKGSGQVTITPGNPFSLIYEDHPLLGMLFNRNLGGYFQLNKPEVKIAAYPFFFSAPDKNSTVNYTWSLNASPVQLPSTQNDIILQRKDDTAGQSVVSVGITNDSKILQQAQNSFVIDYGN